MIDSNNLYKEANKEVDNDNFANKKKTIIDQKKEIRETQQRIKESIKAQKEAQLAE